jgi:hypothetical protein
MFTLAVDTRSGSGNPAVHVQPLHKDIPVKPRVPAMTQGRMWYRPLCHAPRLLGASLVLSPTSRNQRSAYL